MNYRLLNKIFRSIHTEELKYNTVDLALADLAYFIDIIKETRGEYESSKVVLFGGSYAGALAIWFRIRYPHLADAVYASSAQASPVAVYTGKRRPAPQCIPSSQNFVFDDFQNIKR